MKTATETEETLHLLDLSSCPVVHLDVRRWSDGLTAAISCFLVLKLPDCESHNSARHQHLHHVLFLTTFDYTIIFHLKNYLPCPVWCHYPQLIPAYFTFSSFLLVLTHNTKKLNSQNSLCLFLSLLLSIFRRRPTHSLPLFSYFSPDMSSVTQFGKLLLY